MKYPLLIPTLGHGSTDLIDKPKLTLILHSCGLISVKFTPIFLRKFILLTSSIIHMKRDMPLIFSSIMHFAWLKFPILAKTYLSFIHTPIHYIRSYYQTPKNFKLKFFIGILSSLFLAYGLENKYDIIIEKYLGKFWWVSPIFVHILISEYLIYQRGLRVKQILTIPIKVITII